MRQTKEQSYFNYLNDRYYNKSEVMYEVNSKFESYTESVNKKLDSLAEEISIIKENKDNKTYAIMVLEEIVTDLKKEKHELNRENDELKEKNRNLFQSLSDVRANVIELQDEKSSLITAMTLLQREHVLKIENLEAENTNLKCAARSRY